MKEITKEQRKSFELTISGLCKAANDLDDAVVQANDMIAEANQLLADAVYDYNEKAELYREMLTEVETQILLYKIDQPEDWPKSDDGQVYSKWLDALDQAMSDADDVEHEEIDEVDDFDLDIPTSFDDVPHSFYQFE